MCHDGKTLSSVIAIAVAFVLSGPQVRAQSELELISGSSTVMVNGVNGVASFDGSVGNWNVNFAEGLAIPTEAPGTIDLDSVDLSTAGTSDSLTILWSASGYTQTGAFLATVGGTMSAGITAVFGSYYRSLQSTATPLTGSSSFGPYASTTGFSGSAAGTA